MSQIWNSNGTDSRENQQGDYPATSPCSVLEYVAPLVDPAMLAQKNDDVVARGPHILLTCGPQDDDDDNDDK